MILIQKNFSIAIKLFNFLLDSLQLNNDWSFTSFKIFDVRCGNLFDRFSMLEFKIDTESFQMLVVSFVEKIGKRPSQYTIGNNLGKVECKCKQRTPNKISQLTRITRVQIQFAAKYYQNMKFWSLIVKGLQIQLKFIM